MNHLKAWSIGRQLGVCFGAIIVLVLALGLYADTTISTMGKTQEMTVSELSRKVALAGLLDAAAERLRADYRLLVLAAYTKNAQDSRTAATDFQHTATEFREASQGVRELIDGDSEQRIVDTLQRDLDGLTAAFSEAERYCEAGQVEAAEAVRERIVPLARESDEATDQLRNEQNRDLVSSAREASQRVRRSRTTGVILVSLALGLGIIVAFVIRAIAARLRLISSQISEQSDQVASAASQVSSSSQSLAQGSSEQAASLEESSAAAEHVQGMAQKNNEDSHRAADLVVHTAETVDAANRALGLMVAAIGNIDESSKQISQIIKVIDGIAFQTNILALNAAVEAARAGDAGLGFAVVADEVRSLAQNCATAAQQTGTLITNSLAKSREGKETLVQVSTAIGGITADATGLKHLVEAVSSGSQQQTAGIQQLTAGIAEMQRVTHSAAASAEESAAASEELSAQAHQMRSTARELLLIVAGNQA